MKNVAPSLVCDLLNIAVAETDDEVLHGQKKTKLSSVFEEAKLLFSFALPTPTQLFSNTVDDRVDEELKRYLAVPELDHLTGLDPLNWWSVNATNYPIISVLAKKYLAIPASSASFERVFSTAKNITDKKRWRLLPERLHKTIFLRHNQYFWK
ncbi:hypothetical protein EMCRGX_G020403 [Ephydatia muelleri]